MVLPIRQGDIPGIQLRLRRHIAADRTEVWRFLTEPARLSLWLADRAEVDLSLGGGFRLERDTPGGLLIETASTERLDPRRAWVLSFRAEDRRWEAATRLEIMLLDAAGGCEVDVLQGGFHQLAMSSCLTIWEEYRHRWREALDRLAAAVA